MKPHKHAKKYAAMFLNVVGLESAPKAIGELNAVNGLMAKSPALRSMLASPLFSEEERKKALSSLAGRLDISENSVKFVMYLAGLRAAAALGQVIKAAVAIYQEKKMKARATVLTPLPLDSRYDARLRQSLGKITGRDVEIEYVTDPSLLGGMLIKVGSTMYDGSLKGQLRLLKDELVKG